MEFDQIKKMLSDTSYRSVLDNISKQTGEAFDERLDTPLLSIAWSDTRNSGLKEEDFYCILHEQPERLAAYSIRFCRTIGDDDEQEYPEGEEPAPGEEDEIIEVGKRPVIALLAWIIQFHYLLAKDEKGLAVYFKKERIPYAAKFLKQLKGIFSDVMDA